jgi:hypothetical protein
VVAACSQNVLNSVQRLRAVFDYFDKDGGGTIGKEEVARLFTGHEGVLSEEYVNEMMLEVDADGDGEISWDEFVEAMIPKTDESGELRSTAMERLEEAIVVQKRAELKTEATKLETIAAQIESPTETGDR